MKTILKALATGMTSVLVLPAYMLYRMGAFVVGTERVFPAWSQTFSIIPGLTGEYLRRAFYRLALARCGTNCCLSFGTVLSHPTAEIGENVFVGVYCVLGDVTLEDDVLIGSHVSVVNGGSQHGIDRLDVPIREQPGTYPRVTIGQDSWIGDRSVVMANVGRHCVIGAGSVVTKPVPDYAIAVGVPARAVRSRLEANASEHLAH
jgi:virginiamycin A acetyltransferase